MSDESIREKPIERVADTDKSSKNEKRTSLQTGTFLKNKHPELFRYLPRPGGFHRHIAARQNSSRTDVDGYTSKPKNSLSTVRNFSIESHGNTKEILETNIRCPSAKIHVSKADEKNDTVKVCSVVVSTVMMLAQKTYKDITAEHIRHSEEYFRSLRQPDGYPKNVGQLVRLLTNLKINGKIVTTNVEEDENYIDEEDDDEDEEEEEEEEEEADDRVQMSDLINRDR